MERFLLPSSKKKQSTVNPQKITKRINKNEKQAKNTTCSTIMQLSETISNPIKVSQVSQMYDHLKTFVKPSQELLDYEQNNQELFSQLTVDQFQVIENQIHSELDQWNKENNDQIDKLHLDMGRIRDKKRNNRLNKILKEDFPSLTNLINRNSKKKTPKKIISEENLYKSKHKNKKKKQTNSKNEILFDPDTINEEKNKQINKELKPNKLRKRLRKNNKKEKNMEIEIESESESENEKEKEKEKEQIDLLKTEEQKRSSFQNEENFDWMEKGEVNPKEVVLVIDVFGEVVKRSSPIQTIHVLGSQKLTALKDVISCSKEQLVKQRFTDVQFPSGLFYFEKNMYSDLRDPNAIDYSESIIEYTQNNKNLKSGQLPKFERKKMEETYFNELEISIGKIYEYVHLGSCIHSLSFRVIRQFHPNYDKNKLSLYPYVDFKKILTKRNCSACKIFKAKNVIFKNYLADSNPVFLCLECCKHLLYSKEGVLLYPNFEILPYIND
ncbi:snRNA-activating protein complex subunit [Anaeramoeba flamelloides]|uniref:snRNA-activating protein complex subunit n=1 Tax=Anaeramoeba flamelloides TaxID=1746091 RepID=A0AAV7YCU5_9EUKA|nr:snRNA-activating protein complex subunit [Anaeramoeba flamelloides]